MATWSHTGGSTGHPSATRRPYIVTQVVDFADLDAVGTIGTTDVVQAIKVPADTLCLAAGFTILTAETVNTTATLSVGDGGSATRYTAATATNAAAGVNSVCTNDDAFVYDSADTIDLTIATDDPTNCKVRVWAVLVDVTDTETTDNHTWSVA